MSEKGFCFIGIVNGVEGHSVYIGDENTGHRLAGPKPWGGGRMEHRFVVNCEELIKDAIEYGKLDLDETIRSDERAKCLRELRELAKRFLTDNPSSSGLQLAIILFLGELTEDDMKWARTALLGEEKP